MFSLTYNDKVQLCIIIIIIIINDNLRISREHY